MALTEIPVELSSTPGIADSSNATAITIDSSENTTFAGQVIAPNGATSGYYLKQTGGTATPRVTNDGNNWTIIRPGASGSDVAINNYANSANLVVFTDEGDISSGSQATGGALIKGVSGDQADVTNGGAPQYTFVGNAGTGMRRVTANTLAFDAGGNEVFRLIDGYLLAGKTSNDVDAGNGFRFDLAQSAGSNNGAAYASISSSGATWYVRDTTNTLWRFYVTGSGQVNRYSENTLSDERMKKNIKPLETGLKEVLQLTPRRFDWREKYGDGKTNVAGFIAQEVETVFPDLINPFKDDEITDAKGVSIEGIIPSLVNAIKEQQALIETLQTKVKALEEA